MQEKDVGISKGDINMEEKIVKEIPVDKIIPNPIKEHVMEASNSSDEKITGSYSTNVCRK